MDFKRWIQYMDTDEQDLRQKNRTNLLTQAADKFGLNKNNEWWR